MRLCGGVGRWVSTVILRRPESLDVLGTSDITFLVRMLEAVSYSAGAFKRWSSLIWPCVVARLSLPDRQANYKVDRWAFPEFKYNTHTQDESSRRLLLSKSFNSLTSECQDSASSPWRSASQREHTRITTSYSLPGLELDRTTNLTQRTKSVIESTCSGRLTP